MKPRRQQQRNRWKLLLIKALFVLIPTIVIVYFMPRGDEFGYSYELNKPWSYGELIAKNKFPVLKNDSIYQRERAAVMRSFQPYYNYNVTVGDSMVRQLRLKAKGDWNGLNAPLYVRHIAALLDTIYTHGIMSTEDYARLVDVEEHHNIRVVKANVATSVPLSTVYTPRSAYAYMMSTDTAQYSRLALQRYNINELILPNLTFDENLSRVEMENDMQGVSNYSGFVLAGQKIVDRGDLVTEDVYNILRSYEQDFEKRNADEANLPYKDIGQAIFVLVIMLALISYLTLFRDDYFDNLRNVTLLFILPVIFCVVASLMVSHRILNVFMLPCCMVPIVIRVFMDSRTAFVFHCCMVLIISIFLTSNYEFVVMQIVAGLFAIQTLRELSQRSQIVRTAFFLFIVYVVLYTGYSLHHEYDIKMDHWMYICFAVNCTLLLFTYPLIFPA